MIQISLRALSSGERRRHAMEGEPRAVARQAIRRDREIAPRHGLLRSRRHRDAPEVPLPVVLIVRIDIVSRLDARALVLGPRIDGEE